MSRSNRTNQPRPATPGRGGRRRGRTPRGGHVPVMPREVIGCLRPADGETVVDCTIGYGGHAARFCQAVGPAGRVIGLDLDREQLERTRARLAGAAPVLRLHHADYAGLRDVLDAEGIDRADVIFADLGVSSMQIDDAARGMSYQHADAPLDMRMDRTEGKTAADVLAEIDRASLSAALADLADEPDHERIADWIVLQRRAMPLTRCAQLIRLVMDAKGLSERTWRSDPSTRYGELHPAARTFQALRILVNDELGRLGRLLERIPACLRPGGRVGVISFHSGEDRLVKQAFRRGLDDRTYAHAAAKPLTPRDGQRRRNPRSASAKFRWATMAGP